MRKFLATTALTIVMATGAHAATHSTTFMETPAMNEVRGSDFIGARVYAAEFEGNEAESLRIRDNMLTVNDAEREWNDIGEINDILMNRDGEISAILVGVGGFLGIGEKTVAVSMDQLRFVSDGEDADDYFLVINSSQEMLESAPAFTMSMSDDMPMAETSTPAPETNTTMADTDSVAPFPPADFRVEGYEAVALDQLTAEDLDGARVYGIGDEDVGEISSLLVADDGKITGAVVDVGGFMGIGEKPVRVDFDQLSIQREANGAAVRIYIDASQESLEALPDYEG